MKPPKLTVKELTSLCAYFTVSHKEDKALPFLERTFGVVWKFLNVLGYEIVSPDLRIAEARLLDSGLHKEYMQALRQTVVAPQDATFEQAVLLVVMASPEARHRALTKVYERKYLK